LVISERLDSQVIDHKPLIDLKKKSIIGLSTPRLN